MIVTVAWPRVSSGVDTGNGRSEKNGKENVSQSVAS